MAFFRRLFIDFDSFYASIEQQDNLEYRGKPIIVVPVVSDHTCAIAASYQAKRLGVKTGTRVKTAKEKFSKLVMVTTTWVVSTKNGWMNSMLNSKTTSIHSQWQTF
jgi:nucleotidyltransferase/DNA polymerase involved in DNA repair